MESKSFEESLEEILRAYTLVIPVSDDVDYHTDKAKQAIIKLIEEIVPEAKGMTLDDNWADTREDGFNQCRQAILDKLK